MSYADQAYIETCKRILSEGVWDTDLEVRPHWEDGTPAHTVKLFGVVNRYDLSEEFPIMTLRRTFWKSAGWRTWSLSLSMGKAEKTDRFRQPLTR